MFSILRFLLILLCISSSNGQPEIDAGNIKFVGTYMSTRKNRTISAFLGIPFAEPPLGNLRFKNPVPKKELNGVFLANKETTDCLQPLTTNFDFVIGEEDCLTLNVYKPKKLKNQQNKLLPVMVFFHPGYYSVGGAYVNSTGPQYLLDKDIVLVTLRYRLGILGFLSTGDSEAPGNFGLKDQILALQWIQKNIQFFDGDPGKVTLFGSSVGANSIHLHTLSNATKGLFHQCILQAGSAFNPRSFMPRERALEYAKKAGAIFNCPSHDSRLLVECLRNVDAISITRTFSVFNPMQIFTKTFWLPTNEPDMPGAYIIENPFDLLEKKKLRDYPTIVGLNADEGLFWTSALYSNPKFYEKMLGNLETFLINFFEIFKSSDKNVTTLVADVQKFYFENKESNEKQVVLEKSTTFLADFLRNYPQILGVNFHLKSSKQPLYFYLFDYLGTISHTFSDSLTLLGVSHEDELFYLFPESIGVNVKPNATVLLENDHKIIDFLVDFWTSFASVGIPKATHANDPRIWRQYAPEKQILKIGDRREPSLSIIHSLFEDRIDFWEKRYPHHFL